MTKKSKPFYTPILTHSTFKLHFPPSMQKQLRQCAFLSTLPQVAVPRELESKTGKRGIDHAYLCLHQGVLPIFRHIRTSFFGSWPKPSNASAGSLHALIVGGHCLLGTLLDTYLLSISPLAQGTTSTKRHHTQELVKNLALARQMTANNEGPTEKIGVLFQRELISISLFCSSVPQGGALLKNCTFSSRLSSYFKSWMGMTIFFISFYYCSSKERKAFLGNPSSVIIAAIVFDLFTHHC